LLKFRRLLEREALTGKLFEAIKANLAGQGLMLREGTVVDATLIAASPSTKNRARKRDPEMHQARSLLHGEETDVMYLRQHLDQPDRCQLRRRDEKISLRFFSSLGA